MESNELVQGDEPTLRVESLADEFRRRGSDRLMNIPQVTLDMGDLYNVCDVLPRVPTREQYDDLAVRLSNFLEDLHRLHVDCRHSPTDVIGAMAPPMSIPIVSRGKLQEAKRKAIPDERSGLALPMVAWPSERESFCMLYLDVPRWTGATYDVQLSRIDEVARRHGLRCVGVGCIPEH